MSGHVYEATRALFNYIKNQNEPQSFFVSHKDANNDVIKNLPGIIPGYSLSCFEGGDDEVVISNLKNLVKNHDLTKNDVIVFLTGHLREVRVTNEIVKNNLNSPQFIIQIHQYYPPFPEADMILDEDVNGKLENEYRKIFNKIDHNKVNIVITPVKALADKIFSVTDYFPKLFPVPFASMQFPIKYNADSIKIGFFGDGRKEKGILDFMRFVDVSKNNERYNFTVQIQNPRGFSDEEKAELNNLINKIEVNENVTILRGPLPSSEYYKNLCNCDIVCILHDPKHYSIRLSGIAVECGILGIPVIVRIGSSAGNWISEEKLFGELIHNDDFDGPIKRLHSKILEVENVRKVNKLSEKWKSEYSAENYFNNYLLPLITE